jgi:hypothetical protein
MARKMDSHANGMPKCLVNLCCYDDGSTKQMEHLSKRNSGMHGSYGSDIDNPKSGDNYGSTVIADDVTL